MSPIRVRYSLSVSTIKLQIPDLAFDLLLGELEIRQLGNFFIAFSTTPARWE